MPIYLGKILIFIGVLSLSLMGYDFKISVDNPSPMLGEKILLTLHFTYEHLEEYDIEEPTVENLHMTLVEDKEFKDANGTWHVLMRYACVAHTSGIIKLHPLKTHIEMIAPKYKNLYNKNKYLEKFDIYSNTLTLAIRPLPQSLTVTGQYKLFASIDKVRVNPREPIDFKVWVEGEGNIVNLDFLTFKIPHVMIYEKSIDQHTKKFMLLSDQNFSIPPLSIRYYNQKTKSISLLTTNAFDIGINLPSTIKSENTSSSLWMYVFLLLMGVLYITYMSKLFEDIAFVDEKSYLRKQLKKTKNKEELLKKIAPYIHKNRQLMHLIYRLEDIDTASFKKLKKEILTYF